MALLKIIIVKLVNQKLSGLYLLQPKLFLEHNSAIIISCIQSKQFIVTAILLWPAKHGHSIEKEP